ncbi:MAG: hypothetical protein ACXWKQ_02280 [Reyranella sp.]
MDLRPHSASFRHDTHMLTVLFACRCNLHEASAFIQTDAMPNEQETLGSVVAMWRAALVLVCFSVRPVRRTHSPPLHEEGIESGQCVNIIDERRGGEKVGWPVVDVD